MRFSRLGKFQRTVATLRPPTADHAFEPKTWFSYLSLGLPFEDERTIFKHHEFMSINQKSSHSLQLHKTKIDWDLSLPKLLPNTVIEYLDVP